MSNLSENVKTWRKNTKERVVKSLGGKCILCGYNKCFASLALHHLNPEEKEDTLSNLMSDIKSWAKIVKEVRKCVLLCNNCHGEVHAGFTDVPANAPRFNEEFFNYKPNREEFDECPVCSKSKLRYNKTCSKSCASRYRYKVDWDNVNIIEELKTKSILKLADELGCSDSAIHKKMKKLGIKRNKTI